MLQETIMDKSVNLRSMRVGEKGKIAHIEGQGIVNQRIRDMGIIPGASIMVVGKAPLKDPVAVRLGGITIALRNREADHILVNLEE